MLIFLNLITNCPGEPQMTPDSQKNLEKEGKAGGITIPDFKIYYKAVIKQYGTGTKINTQMKRTEQSAEINTLLYGQLLYDKGGKNIQCRKDLFNKWVLVKLDSYMQKNETGPLSNTIHKNKLKMNQRLKCES